MKYLIIGFLLISTVYSNDFKIQDNYGNTYKPITSPHTGKIWLDRNLGAKRVCTSINDSLCYGSYFQWGRKADGHENANSKSTTVLSDSEVKNHNKYIINLNGGHKDWLISPNNMLWQSPKNINNPCPEGFKVPTTKELLSETIDIGLKNRYDLFNSFLKIPSAGYRFYGDDGDDYIVRKGSAVSLHSSTTHGKNSGYLYSDYMIFKGGHSRSTGCSIRCIKK